MLFVVRRDYIFMSDEQARRIFTHGPSKDEDYLRELISDISGDKTYAESLAHFELLLEGRLIFQVACRRRDSLKTSIDVSANRKRRKQQELPFT